ncbi:MAG: transglutaminase-like domain-containing protein [Planctomycetota bacterium]
MLRDIRGAARNAVWTLAMAVLASLVFELAAVESGRESLSSLGKPLWLGAIALLVFAFIPRLPRLEALARGPSAEILLAIAGVFPFAVQWFSAGSVSPVSIDYQLLAGVRNIALLGAALGRVGRMRYLVAATSLFLVLFSYSVAPTGWVLLLTIAYACLGVIWLMSEHWSRVARAPLAAQTSRLPGVPTALLCLSVVFVAGLAILLYPDEVSFVGRLLATWTGQVIDQSPRRLAELLNSQQEALGELTQQKYGSEDTSGAADGTATADMGGAAQNPLMQAFQAQGRGRRWGQGEQPQRYLKRPQNFSVVRKGAAPKPKQDPKGIFQMDGPAGLRMPVTTYDYFDGRSWQAEMPPLGGQMSAQITEQGAWTSLVPRPNFPLDPALQSQAVEEVQRGLPSLSEHEDVVEWARAMAGRLTDRFGEGGRLVEPTLREIDVQRLADLLAASPMIERDLNYLATHQDVAAVSDFLNKNPELAKQIMKIVAEDGVAAGPALMARWLRTRMADPSRVVDPDIQALADKWREGREKGWDEIQGIVEGIRRHATHDPAAKIPATAKNPIKHFLIESRRGPDYAFASATAQILRGLGYPSRMVGGFYAQPENYNWYTGRTTLYPDDVHFWTQVRLGDETWIDLEPTPGYELPGPPRSWNDYLAEIWAKVRAFVARYGAVLGISALLASLALLARRWVADQLATWLWRWQVRSAPYRAVPATWRLIERRARLVHRGRPAGQTLHQWYASLATEVSAELEQLAAWQDRLAHAPEPLRAAGLPDADTIRHTCRNAAATCTRRHFRRLARPSVGARAVSTALSDLSRGGAAASPPRRAGTVRRTDAKLQPREKV